MEGYHAKPFGYLRHIWQLRYFWFSLVHIDLTNRYKRSFFGIGWSLLRPLSMTFILCMVFGKLFHIPLEDYAPYLLVGMTIWQFLTESLQQGCNSFSQGSTFIRQQRLPLAIFSLRSVLGSGFHLLVSLGLALILALLIRGCPNPWALLFLLPALIVLFFLGWFLATLASAMQAHFPDTKHLLEIGLQILYFVTPILYRTEELGDRGRLRMLVEFNPFSSILALVRTPILDGTPPALYQIAISFVFVLLLGGLTILLMRKVERSLIFWI